ncbi:MAG: hypothetical protein ACT4QA_17810 [Panacagrimonas sp.]
MARVHLFEWEDQSWFPALFRNFITDHLVFLVSRLFVPVVPKLVELMKTTGHHSIVDLCSGGGGPLLALLPRCSAALGRLVTATLTDLFPNLETFARAHSLSGGTISYRSESVSAMDCPETLHGVRTIFTALHHFRPEQARKILADAVAKGVLMASFEAQERSLSKLVVVPLVAFLGALIMTPFVGRMSWGRFVFTYLVPLAPAFFAWDGFVSCLRTYSPRELGKLTERLDENGYHWEIGQIPSFGIVGPYNITYLIGIPSKRIEDSPALGH